MTETPARPLPHPTVLSDPHWDGAREGRLMVQQCNTCQTYTFPPKRVCDTCFSTELEWRQSSGKGRIYSYTIIHRAPHPGFVTPYCVAIVDLEEGWQMLSNVVDCDVKTIAAEQAVTVRFEDRGEMILPVFAPASS